jgi:hypothetical protein
MLLLTTATAVKDSFAPEGGEIAAAPDTVATAATNVPSTGRKLNFDCNLHLRSPKTSLLVQHQSCLAEQMSGVALLPMAKSARDTSAFSLCLDRQGFYQPASD